jgi:hypothetical protein
MKTGKRTQVYQMAIQLYPLTAEEPTPFVRSKFRRKKKDEKDV